MSLLRATDINTALWKNDLVSFLQSFLHYLKILQPRRGWNQISPNAIWEDRSQKAGLEILGTPISEPSCSDC